MFVIPQFEVRFTTTDGPFSLNVSEDNVIAIMKTLLMNGVVKIKIERLP